MYPHYPQHKFGTPEWNELVLKTRQEEKERIDNYYQRLLTRSDEISELYRVESKQRVEKLSEVYRSQRNEMADIWNLREQFRVETEKKNAGLYYLLKRGKDAKTAAAASEAAAEAERLKQEAKNKKKK